MSATRDKQQATETFDGWTTPSEFLDALLERYPAFAGVTLDAAADETNSKAPHYLAGPHIGPGCGCGLCADWHDATWCNPPYGDQIPRWVAKAVQEWERGRTVYMLLPANVGPRWFDTVFETASRIDFLRPRINFGDPRNPGSSASNIDSMLLVWRPGRRAPRLDLWHWKGARLLAPPGWNGYSGAEWMVAAGLIPEAHVNR